MDNNKTTLSREVGFSDSINQLKQAMRIKPDVKPINIGGRHLRVHGTTPHSPVQLSQQTLHETGEQEGTIFTKSQEKGRQSKEGINP